MVFRDIRPECCSISTNISYLARGTPQRRTRTCSRIGTYMTRVCRGLLHTLGRCRCDDFFVRFFFLFYPSNVRSSPQLLDTTDVTLRSRAIFRTTLRVSLGLSSPLRSRDTYIALPVYARVWRNLRLWPRTGNNAPVVLNVHETRARETWRTR